jgi:hypothetical protein
MIYSDESSETAMAPEEERAMMAEYRAFFDQATAAGVVEGGDRLRPTSTATVVRVRDGETLTTDGPYADTKEQLGGYFILKCADLDEALGWAAKIPGARHGSIEVRPIWDGGDA